jgi:hypothetical protein
MEMRSLLASALLAASIAVLAGCATTASEDPAVANLPRTQVKGAELRQMVEGQRMSSVRFGFLVNVDFRSDGVSFARVPEFPRFVDQGKWWFSDKDEVCLQWPGRFSPNNGCFTVERRSDGAIFGRESANPTNTQRINIGAIQPGG